MVEVKTMTMPTYLNMKKKCFKCQGFGYFQTKCPNKRIIAVQEIEEIYYLKKNCIAMEIFVGLTYNPWL